MAIAIPDIVRVIWMGQSYKSLMFSVLNSLLTQPHLREPVLEPQHTPNLSYSNLQPQCVVIIMDGGRVRPSVINIWGGVSHRSAAAATSVGPQAATVADVSSVVKDSRPNEGTDRLRVGESRVGCVTRFKRGQWTVVVAVRWGM